jgi:hypothetical protein
MSLSRLRGLSDKTKRRLRMVAIAGIAVTALVVLPGHLASRPDFFGRYPALEAKYVPWSASTHAEARCEDCHVSPRPTDRAVYRLRMVGEFYLSVVDRDRQPGYFESPGNDACLACHNDLRSVSPNGDLQIPHRAHINVLEMRCVDCHDYLVHEAGPSGERMPAMEGCLECHDGDVADDACTSCHTQKAAPETHASAEWLVDHAYAAADDGCRGCHDWTEDWCVDCHRHRPESHGTDWRATHGERLTVHRNCEACHEAEFCVPCHGEFPDTNLDPTLGLVD